MLKNKSGGVSLCQASMSGGHCPPFPYPVAQVFNLCTGVVLLSPGGTGFQPVNPLRIIGSQAGTPAPLRLNARVRDGIGCGIQ